MDKLGGCYITAEDVGTTVPDLVELSKTTQFVAGLPTEMGGSGGPSPWVALVDFGDSSADGWCALAGRAILVGRG